MFYVFTIWILKNQIPWCTRNHQKIASVLLDHMIFSYCKVISSKVETLFAYEILHECIQQDVLMNGVNPRF